jgi:transposase
VSNIARFPGLTLSIGTDPLEGYIDYYSKILHPARQETTIPYFDEAGTRIHTTSDIELTADQITIRDNSGRIFLPTYTPEAHWSLTDP